MRIQNPVKHSSEFEQFEKKVDISQPLPIFAKRSILDINQVSECAYGSISKLVHTDSRKFDTRNFIQKLSNVTPANIFIKKSRRMFKEQPAKLSKSQKYCVF